MSENDYKIEILEGNVDNCELSFKIIIIGDLGVGKSCLAIRNSKNIFDSIYQPTIGFDFISYPIKINDHIIKMQIWDTCGQEVYRSLISSFYNNTSLAIIVYAIDNEQSFKNLEFWLNELRTKSNPDINIFLVGNKCDLEENRQVSKKSGQEFSQIHKIKLFMESSAKTGINAHNIFIEAAKLLYEQYLKNNKSGMNVNNPSRRINEYERSQSKQLEDVDIDEISVRRKKCC